MLQLGLLVGRGRVRLREHHSLQRPAHQHPAQPRGCGKVEREEGRKGRRSERWASPGTVSRRSPLHHFAVAVIFLRQLLSLAFQGRYPRLRLPYIYRLITQGTPQKRIWSRQRNKKEKTCLPCRVGSSALLQRDKQCSGPALHAKMSRDGAGRPLIRLAWAVLPWPRVPWLIPLKKHCVVAASKWNCHIHTHHVNVWFEFFNNIFSIYLLGSSKGVWSFTAPTGQSRHKPRNSDAHCFKALSVEPAASAAIELIHEGTSP